MRAWLGAVVGAIAATASLAGQAQDDWQAAARTDIAAAYDIFVANHPGMHDPANPGFPAQLARARDAGLAEAARTHDEAGYQQSLAAFSAVLSDGHAKILPKQPQATGPAKPAIWPGFVAAWRGDRLLVHHADARFAMPVGSVIAGCDGLDTRALIRRKLLVRGFRPEEAGGWWFWSPRMLAPPAALAAQAPQRCSFVAPDGARRDLTLEWTPAPDNLPALLDAASDGERTEIGLSEPSPGVFLIGLPDFGPDAAEVAAYQTLFETLKAREAALQAARAVVLDLRFNNGGSSSWSLQTARALWGAGTVDAAMDNYHRNVRVWWRASEGNAGYVEGTAPQLRAGGNPEGADMFAKAGAGMRAALARGEPFYIDGETKPAKEVTVPATRFTTPVYVITPGRCGSACLDAIDTFKRFPNVRLIGAPTSADSTYMEVRAADLPSGKGRAVIPNKAWSGRPRKAGEVYTPDIAVDDLDWSTATFLSHVEKALAQGRSGAR